MPNSERLEHLLLCAKRGASSGASDDEKNARAIVEVIMDGAIGLDADATAGIGELANHLYARGFEARNEIRVLIGPKTEDVHYLELRDEESGLRHYLEGRPLHAGDLVDVFTKHGWEQGRYEWSYNESNPPSVWFDQDDGMVIDLEQTPCRQPIV